MRPSKKRARRVQVASPAQHENSAEAGKRHVMSYLQVWRACEGRRCKRQKSCAGDASACFDRWWPHVPEVIKVMMQEAIRLHREGYPAAEATRLANIKGREFREQEAKSAVQDAERAAAHAAPVAEKPFFTPPRVRML